MTEYIKTRLIIGFILTTVVVGFYVFDRGWLGWIPLKGLVVVAILLSILFIARDIYATIFS